MSILPGYSGDGINCFEPNTIIDSKPSTIIEEKSSNSLDKKSTEKENSEHVNLSKEFKIDNLKIC